jgi:hypothetical protein
MNTELLQKNLALLPGMKEIFEKSGLKPYECEQARKNDNLTLKIDSVYIHSRYDPAKESDRIVEYLSSDKENIDVYILYGSGLGYILQSLYCTVLQDNTEITRPYIIYIEKDLRLFYTSLHHFDWCNLLQDEHVKVFVDAPFDVAGSFIQEIPTKRTRYYYHRPTFISNEPYYREVQNHIHFVLDRKDMNNATFQRFQKLWTRNFIYNLPSFSMSRPVNELRSLCNEGTVAIVAGGPTVEKCLPFLRDNSERIVIIAVDTVFKYLRANGIDPDIVVTIDPQYWNYKYLENENFEKTIVVTDALTYYKIFQMVPCGSIFTPSSIFPLVNFFEDSSRRGTMIAGGSVSTTAFETARYLGARQVVLCGLDLSFPDRNIHFRGAFFENRFLTFQNYLETVEKHAYSYLAHVPLFPVESTSGTVYTDKKMLLFKKWFDREVPLFDGTVLLPDHGGVTIDGAQIVTLNTIEISGDFNKTVYKKSIERVCRQHVSGGSWLEKVDSIIRNCDPIARSCRNIIRAIPESGEVTEKQALSVNQEEERLYSDPERKKVMSVISSSAQDVLLSIKENVNMGDGDKLNPWISTRELYASVHDLTIFFEKKIGNLLKIMSKKPNIKA